MKNETDIAFYNTSPKYEVLMAVLIGIGICLTRLATAVSQIALAIATILAAYLWWKNGKRLNLNDTARQYIKVVCIWFITSFVSIIDVDNKAVVFYYFLGDWI